MRIARLRAGGLALVVATAVAVPLISGPVASADDERASRQLTFSTAAAEFGVPEEVLLAVAYNESRWETHEFLPSEQGGYGPMHLTDLDTTPRGDVDTSTPAFHTADAAADLIGTTADEVKSSEVANIRGGAALLGAYAKDLNDGSLPTATGAWYTAIAKFAGAEYRKDALAFADDVFATMRDGATETTIDGERVTLLPSPSVAPDRSGTEELGLRSSLDSAKTKPGAGDTECPPLLDCRTIETAYHLFDPDLANYCNYDTADRPRDSFVEFIVIHDTEEDYETTTQLPPNPNYCASWHYLVRSADGHVDQALGNNNVGWQAGNWWINTHSIGIEQEGWASRGTRWFTEEMYRSTARLVRYLGKKYDIPLDRAHIIGHDNVPPGGSNPATMHWDPGPYWDWDHFMNLVGSPITATAGSRADVVTIKPNFNRNRLVFEGCVPANEPVDGGECGTSPALPSSRVQLHNAPSTDAPLLSDVYFHPDGSAGTIEYSDLSAVAPTGAEYVVADRQGDWTAIWFGGQKAWFHNPHNSAVVPTRSEKVTPESGAAPVYGFAYPRPDEIPVDEPREWFERRYRDPIAQYAIEPGQEYVLLDTFQADIYAALLYDESAPGDRTDYFGEDEYYLIWFNHREMFVKASDVAVVR